jgi:hypothetical protein
MFNGLCGFGFINKEHPTITTIRKANENIETRSTVRTNTSPFRCPTRSPSPNES